MLVEVHVAVVVVVAVVVAVEAEWVRKTAKGKRKEGEAMRTHHATQGMTMLHN